VAPAQRLLVVQPHDDVREALHRMLLALAPHSRVDEALSGRQALARLADTGLAADPYMLLIVDWVLPDMDGAELLRRLRAEGCGGAVQRVALLAAYETPSLRESAQALGAHELLAKPVLPAELRRLLGQAGAPKTVAASQESVAGAADRRLVDQLDALLGESDSHAVTFWQQHESSFVDLLPAAQVQALAGAMHRYEFDEALTALRRAREGAGPK
jgi:CheY-like chemotaxis protein